MSVVNYIFLILFSFFSSSLSQAAKKEVSSDLIELEKIEPLADDHGYLLIDLDINGTAPSLVFSKIKGQKLNYLEKTKVRLKLTGSRKIDLKEKKKELYLMPLPKGLYQITRINAPFFDLPFRLNTNNRRDWRFSIENGKLNYIGKLFIDKERSSNAVMIRLFNRIATDQEKLQNQIQKLSLQYPLESAAGVRDDFYEEYLTPSYLGKVDRNTSSSNAGEE